MGDPTVGNGDPMGVAGNVLEYVIRFFYRLPHADNPFVSVEFIFKQFVSVAESDFTAFNRTCQKVNELAAEDQRQSLLVEQVVFLHGIQRLPFTDMAPPTIRQCR